MKTLRQAEAGQETAFLSKRLATIALDAPVACALMSCTIRGTGYGSHTAVCRARLSAFVTAHCSLAVMSQSALPYRGIVSFL